MKALRTIAIVLVSAFLEKNPLKVAAVAAPVALSAKRLVAIGLAVVWSIVALSWGIDGWPMAVVGVALVFALPVMAALDRLPPDASVQLAEKIIDRLGGGDHATPD